MQKYKQIFDRLLKQNLTRRQFFRMVAAVMLSVAGVMRLVESLDKAPNEEEDTYGEGGYGGYVLGDKNDPMQIRKKKGQFN
jgi:hypothetical protein